LRAEWINGKSWRVAGIEAIQQALDQKGFTGTLIDVTPNLDRQGNIFINATRGHEIRAWLENRDVNQFVILDDDPDMEPLSDNLILTSFEHGLQDEHVEQIIEIFS